MDLQEIIEKLENISWEINSIADEAANSIQQYGEELSKRLDFLISKLEELEK